MSMSHNIEGRKGLIERRNFIRAGSVGMLTFAAGCIGETTEDTESRTLKTAITSEVAFMDPRNMQTTQHTNWNKLLYSGLLKWNYVVEEDSFEIVAGDLVQDWEVIQNDNEVIYQFEINDDATYHNGDDVTAESVRDELDYWLDPEVESQSGSFIEDSVSQLSIDNSNLFNIHLNEPDITFEVILQRLFQFANPYVREEMGEDAFNRNPVDGGSGPYKFVEREEGTNILLERYDDYHIDYPVTNDFERVEVKIVPEDSTRRLRLETKDLHIDHWVDITNYNSMKEETDIEARNRSPSPSWVLAFINHDIKPLDDIRVRQALIKSVDIDGLFEAVYSGLAEKRHIPNLGDQFEFPELENRYQYDVDEARQLLADAGYEDGFELEYTSANVFPQNAMDEVLQDMWGEIGIDITINRSEYSAYADNLFEPNFEIAAHVWSGEPIPATHEFEVFHSSSDLKNLSNGWQSDEFEAAIESARSTLDEEERRDHLEEMFTVMSDELPALYFGARDNLAVHRREINGFYVSPFRNVSNFALREVSWDS